VHVVRPVRQCYFLPMICIMPCLHLLNLDFALLFTIFNSSLLASFITLFVKFSTRHCIDDLIRRTSDPSLGGGCFPDTWSVGFIFDSISSRRIHLINLLVSPYSRNNPMGLFQEFPWLMTQIYQFFVFVYGQI